MHLESNSTQYQYYSESTFDYERTEIRILYAFNRHEMNHFFNQDLRLRYENTFLDRF